MALVSGEVSEILNRAQSYATGRVSESIADLEQFKAKQAQFEANPMLMVARDWSLAMGEFLEKDFVSTMYLPEEVQAELIISADPDIEAERLRQKRRKEAVDAMLKRREDLTRNSFKTDRGIQAEDAE